MKSPLLRNALLRWVFWGETAPWDLSSTFEISLHTADPVNCDDQKTAECKYAGYARVRLPRNAEGWSIQGNRVVPFKAVEFPACESGEERATHWAVGVGGTILYSGPILKPKLGIAVSEAVVPVLTTGSQITEA